MCFKVLYKNHIYGSLCNILFLFFPWIICSSLYFAASSFSEKIYQIDRCFSSFFCAKDDPRFLKRQALFLEFLSDFTKYSMKQRLAQMEDQDETGMYYKKSLEK